MNVYDDKWEYVCFAVSSSAMIGGIKKTAMEGKIVKITSPENVFLIKELQRVRLSDTRVFFDDGFSVCSVRVFGS